MIYRATVEFSKQPSLFGRSDWAVEAATETQVRDLVITALARDGRALVRIRVSEASREERDRDRLFDGIGVSLVIRENRLSQAAPDVQAGALPAETALPVRLAGDETWIPAVLFDFLFRQAAPDDRIFAILEETDWTGPEGSIHDAADLAGVPAASLYDLGSAETEGRNAPWLVDLTAPDASPDRAPTMLHKRLMSRPEMLRTCVFLRVPLPLNELRARLRKLTRIRDLDDKWYYCRFWEPEFFLYMVLFLEQRRLLSPLEDLRGFAVVVEDQIITCPTNLRAASNASTDRARDLDLLFDAGVAMIALRHARVLERDYQHGLRPYDVYRLARNRLSLRGMDYRFVQKCVDIAYSALHFYGDDAIRMLDDSIVAKCFDEHGDLQIFIEYLHGITMFALIHDIAPHKLRSDAGFSNVRL